MWFDCPGGFGLPENSSASRCNVSSYKPSALVSQNSNAVLCSPNSNREGLYVAINRLPGGEKPAWPTIFWGSKHFPKSLGIPALRRQIGFALHILRVTGPQKERKATKKNHTPIHRKNLPAFHHAVKQAGLHKFLSAEGAEA